ncbi:MAG: tetratricopeptide repeat protein [Acidobacteria bacterium]|nr:tetratricopeptide repeat protein [Acidobacteriota bacterium]
MQEIKDQWIWYVDGELIPALLKLDPAEPQLNRRAAACESFVKAVHAHLEGDSEEALAELARGASDPKDAAECYSAMGQIQFEMNRLDEAASSYAKAAHADPQSKTAYFNRAVCLEKLRNHKEAALAFEKAAQADPNRPEPRLGLGICLLQLKKPKQALETFEQTLNRDANNPTAQFGKAVALQLQWQFDPAADIYRRLLQRNPNAEEVLVNLISIGVSRKDPANLKEYCDRLQRIRPKSRPVLEGYSTLALSAGDWDAAARYGNDLTAVEGDMFEAWFNLGVAQLKLNRHEAAIKAFSKAGELRADHPAVYGLLAYCADQKGDWEIAKAAYEKAIQASPDNQEPLWNLALAHEKRGQFTDAEKVYMRLVRVAPDSAEAWFRLGHLRAERGNWKASAEAFEQCTSLRGDWTDALVNLGVAYWSQGDRDTASNAFEMALQNDPRNVEVLRALSHLYVEMNDLAKAEETEAKLSGLGESTAEILYHVGLARQKSGEHEHASRCYRQALYQKPKFSEALINLGHALRAMGDEQEARKVWRQAVEHQPELADTYFAKMQR